MFQGVEHESAAHQTWHSVNWTTPLPPPPQLMNNEHCHTQLSLRYCTFLSMKSAKTKSLKKIQTRKRFKRVLIYYDTDTQRASFLVNPLHQATKRHLTVKRLKNDEKWDDLFSGWVVYFSRARKTVQAFLPSTGQVNNSTKPKISHLIFHHFQPLSVKCRRLTKGITPKTCIPCDYVIINKRFFQSFMCLDLLLECYQSFMLRFFSLKKKQYARPNAPGTELHPTCTPPPPPQQKKCKKIVLGNEYCCTHQPVWYCTFLSMRSSTTKSLKKQ